MADISIHCSSCNTEYEVPEEMLGQDVECTECGGVFTVVVSQISEESGSTNTVKISRAGVGMVPQLDDDFVVNLVDEDQAPKMNLESKNSAKDNTNAAKDGKGWKFWKK